MNNDFNFIINPNFNWDNFAGIFDTKVYVVDKDGNEKELPEKYIIRLPKKENKENGIHN